MKLFIKIIIVIIFSILALFGVKLVLIIIDDGLSEVIKSLLEVDN